MTQRTTFVLVRQLFHVERIGLEPTTPCLQNRLGVVQAVMPDGELSRLSCSKAIHVVNRCQFVHTVSVPSVPNPFPIGRMPSSVSITATDPRHTTRTVMHLGDSAERETNMIHRGEPPGRKRVGGQSLTAAAQRTQRAQDTRSNYVRPAGIPSSCDVPLPSSLGDGLAVLDSAEFAVALIEADPHPLAAIRASFRWGWLNGYRIGFAGCEWQFEDAWRPVAERVRRSAEFVSWDQLVALRGEYRVGPGQYRALPRPDGEHGCDE